MRGTVDMSSNLFRLLDVSAAVRALASTTFYANPAHPNPAKRPYLFDPDHPIGTPQRSPGYHGFLNRFDTQYNILDIDTAVAAMRLKELGFNPVSLNLANAENAGGGWVDGARAQEESLFRVSTYHANLWPHRWREGAPVPPGTNPYDRYPYAQVVEGDPRLSPVSGMRRGPGMRAYLGQTAM